MSGRPRSRVVEEALVMPNPPPQTAREAMLASYTVLRALQFVSEELRKARSRAEYFEQSELALAKRLEELEAIEDSLRVRAPVVDLADYRARKGGAS